MIYLIYKKLGEYKAGYHKWLFTVPFITVVLYYLLYPRHVPEYYFLALMPLTLLYFSALVVSGFSKRYLAAISICLLVFVTAVNAYQIYHSYRSYDKPLLYKDKTVQTIINHQQDRGDFSVSYITEYGLEYGYQYFFTLYGAEPRKEIQQPVYSIVYPAGRVYQNEIYVQYGGIGIIVPEEKIR